MKQELKNIINSMEPEGVFNLGVAAGQTALKNEIIRALQERSEETGMKKGMELAIKIIKKTKV